MTRRSFRLAGQRAASGPAKRVLLLIFLLVIGCNDRTVPAPAPAPQSSENQPQNLPTVPMKLGARTVTLQVADEDKEREKGLMFRKSMPRDEGMIFVFPGDAPRGFWMANVPIDLDIVFVDHARKIVSIHTMQAYDRRTTPSDGEAQYAIELNAGAAKELGLSVGQVLDIPSGLRDQDR